MELFIVRFNFMFWSCLGILLHYAREVMRGHNGLVRIRGNEFAFVRELPGHFSFMIREWLEDFTVNVLTASEVVLARGRDGRIRHVREQQGYLQMINAFLSTLTEVVIEDVNAVVNFFPIRRHTLPLPPEDRQRPASKPTATGVNMSCAQAVRNHNSGQFEAEPVYQVETTTIQRPSTVHGSIADRQLHDLALVLKDHDGQTAIVEYSSIQLVGGNSYVTIDGVSEWVEVLQPSASRADLERANARWLLSARGRRIAELQEQRANVAGCPGGYLAVKDPQVE